MQYLNTRDSDVVKGGIAQRPTNLLTVVQQFLLQVTYCLEIKMAENTLGIFLMLTSLIRLKGKNGHPSCFCQRLISQGERRVNIFHTGDGRAHHLLLYHFWKLLWLGEQGLVSPFPEKIQHCSVTVRSNTAVK